MNVTPEQNKVEAGGTQNNSSAVVHDRTGLYVGILAVVIASLGYGDQHGNQKAVELKQDQQDLQISQRLAQQDKLIRDLETEVMLLRQDVADLRVEAGSKLQPRARAK